MQFLRFHAVCGFMAFGLTFFPTNKYIIANNGEGGINILQTSLVKRVIVLKTWPNCSFSNDGRILYSLCCILVFKCCFSPAQGYFTYIETSPIAGEGLQILTYTRHLWPLSSEGSLTCHTHCDTGHRFLLSQSERQGRPTVEWRCGNRTPDPSARSRTR